MGRCWYRSMGLWVASRGWVRGSKGEVVLKGLFEEPERVGVLGRARNMCCSLQLADGVVDLAAEFRQSRQVECAMAVLEQDGDGRLDDVMHGEHE